MLSMEVFLVVIEYLSDMKGWNISGPSKSRLYQQIFNLIDDESFEQLADRTIAVMDYAKPDSVLAEVKSWRRQQVAAQSKALPPGTPQGPEICEEMAQFMRVGAMIKRRGEGHGGCPYGGCGDQSSGKPHCQCVADIFAEPLEEGWESTAADMVNPMGAIYGTPAPDPKETDVVWVDG